MSRQIPLTVLPFGLLELDASGLVIHYCPASEEKALVRAKGVFGRNFFTDIAPKAAPRQRGTSPPEVTLQCNLK